MGQFWTPIDIAGVQFVALATTMHGDEYAG